jgi:hypothetical protein
MRHHKRQDLNPLYPGLIDISWEGRPWEMESDISFSLDGRSLGVIADKQALIQGQSLAIDETNSLFVQWQDTGLSIKLNRKGFKGSDKLAQRLAGYRKVTMIIPVIVLAIFILEFIFPNFLGDHASYKIFAVFSASGRPEWFILLTFLMLGLFVSTWFLSMKRIGLIFVLPAILVVFYILAWIAGERGFYSYFIPFLFIFHSASFYFEIHKKRVKETSSAIS